MNRLRLVAAGAITITLIVAGCAAKKKLAPAAPPGPFFHGKASYTYIFDPANPALGLPADVQFVRPLAVDTKTLPRYPERALAAGDGPHREVVRIVIDPNGAVSQVLDSPLALSDSSLFAADYRESVDDAVRAWRFEPGRFQHVKDGTDKDGDGKPDYKVMTSWETTAVYYDIRFTFEIVQGKPVVSVMP